MSRSRKIVFFFPSFASSDATAPLGILAVATPLERAGFEICLIDSTITPNYKKRVLEEVRDALCLSISLVTGPMIRETAEIARAIKEWNPAFPIILGGWHPSLLKPNPRTRRLLNQSSSLLRGRTPQRRNCPWPGCLRENRSSCQFLAHVTSITRTKTWELSISSCPRGYS